ncbi:FlgB family protein [Pseudorhodobacter sp.]|uniref:FlgB family protein n=1 Tax=Pseudorhodobacter sp. TaxID=1934400 RepID=UPI0026487D3B|nr:FlgB family protein [Pseudorhodobacter sp.]MDN5787565.1 FlgB family protein [Pseudorhodobacter sp.]
MFEKLEITRMAQALSAHAGARMGVIAQNVAHADVPGYKARDVPAFAATYEAASGDGMRATLPGHFGSGDSATAQPIVLRGSVAPNGNGVSLEVEMVKAAQVRQEHDMALSIYRSTSNILKLALGRGR